jgi:hypothetical protein
MHLLANCISQQFSGSVAPPVWHWAEYFVGVVSQRVSTRNKLYSAHSELMRLSSVRYVRALRSFASSGAHYPEFSDVLLLSLLSIKTLRWGY